MFTKLPGDTVGRSGLEMWFFLCQTLIFNNILSLISYCPFPKVLSYSPNLFFFLPSSSQCSSFLFFVFSNIVSWHSLFHWFSHHSVLFASQFSIQVSFPTLILGLSFIITQMLPIQIYILYETWENLNGNKWSFTHDIKKFGYS